MSDRPNTFGDYEFADWVPEHTREIIRNFWGQMGRTHESWLKDAEWYTSDTSHHGPNPNGFRMPPNGARAEYFIKDWELTKQRGHEVFYIVEGRFLHRWNNMGSLIDDYGKDHTVSSCDRWVRIWQSDEERDLFVHAQKYAENATERMGFEQNAKLR